MYTFPVCRLSFKRAWFFVLPIARSCCVPFDNSVMVSVVCHLEETYFHMALRCKKTTYSSTHSSGFIHPVSFTSLCMRSYTLARTQAWTRHLLGLCVCLQSFMCCYSTFSPQHPQFNIYIEPRQTVFWRQPSMECIRMYSLKCLFWFMATRGQNRPMLSVYWATVCSFLFYDCSIWRVECCNVSTHSWHDPLAG